MKRFLVSFDQFLDALRWRGNGRIVDLFWRRKLPANIAKGLHKLWTPDGRWQKLGNR